MVKKARWMRIPIPYQLNNIQCHEGQQHMGLENNDNGLFKKGIIHWYIDMEK